MGDQDLPVAVKAAGGAQKAAVVMMWFEVVRERRSGDLAVSQCRF